MICQGKINPRLSKKNFNSVSFSARNSASFKTSSCTFGFFVTELIYFLYVNCVSLTLQLICIHKILASFRYYISLPSSCWKKREKSQCHTDIIRTTLYTFLIIAIGEIILIIILQIKYVNIYFWNYIKFVCTKDYLLSVAQRHQQNYVGYSHFCAEAVLSI